MVRTEKWAFYLWAIFMGLLGMLYPPTGDFYRYQMDFYKYQGLDFNTFLFVVGVDFNFFLSFLSYFVGKLGLNFDITRFIYNFIAYSILGKLFIDIVYSNLNIKHCSNKSKFKILLLLFSFTIATYLYRYGLSSIFLYTVSILLLLRIKKMDGFT